MRKIIVNIILPIVIDETEAIVAAYPDQPQHTILITPDSRRRIINHVLSRMPGVYLAVDEIDRPDLRRPAYCTPDQRQQIQALVQEGIQHVLQTQDGERSPAWVEAQPQPSSWFG